MVDASNHKFTRCSVWAFNSYEELSWTELNWSQVKKGTGEENYDVSLIEEEKVRQGS